MNKISNTSEMYTLDIKKGDHVIYHHDKAKNYKKPENVELAIIDTNPTLKSGQLLLNYTEWRDEDLILGFQILKVLGESDMGEGYFVAVNKMTNKNIIIHESGKIVSKRFQGEKNMYFIEVQMLTMCYRGKVEKITKRLAILIKG